MDDFGIADTNDPAVHVVWERHGRTVTIALVPAAEPQHGTYCEGGMYCRCDVDEA